MRKTLSNGICTYIDPNLYRKAFQAYLYKGTPIEWSIKQERPTNHYIWRTRGDDKVRSEHAANNGRIFAWNDPRKPATLVTPQDAAARLNPSCRQWVNPLKSN